VHGNIFDRHSQRPVGNALVYIIDQNAVIVGFGMTSEDGNYNIPEVPVGRYCVLAIAPGLMQDNDANSSTSDSLVVEFSSGQGDYQANITMDLDTTTAVTKTGNVVPKVYALEQNYPNPFNPTTAIHYLLPENGAVSLRIFNILGQEIVTLVNGTRQAGEYTALWNGLDRMNQPVPSGVYFYQIQIKNQTGIVFEQIHKMTLMR